MDENQHFKRPVSCEECRWTGLSGDLIAGNKVGLRCPKCDSPSIRYFVADAPASMQ